eukprot:TRINITY_DN19059_c0_g1_i1.p1 TRINITY_DN19059_c0_g1~~TRINITY_DN19059_c0_g1_i1.p1  ORF type:complete len:553 (+),score=59.72 TRINITY_DN19059_c0_g1_i1:58-1659(+)
MKLLRPGIRCVAGCARAVVQPVPFGTPLVANIFPFHEALLPCSTEARLLHRFASRRFYGSAEDSSPKSSRRWLKIGFLLGGAIALPVGFFAFLRPDGGALEVDMSRRNLFTDFLNTEILYHSVSTGEIIFTLFVLKLGSLEFLSKYGPGILNAAEKVGLEAPLYYLIRKTFFKQFYAGETYDELATQVQQLSSEGIYPILDHATENEESVAGWEANRLLAESLVVESSKLGAKFVPVKVTQLGSADLLRRLSSLLTYKAQHGGQMVNWAFRPNPAATEPAPLEFSIDERRDLDAMVKRLRSVCDVAAPTGVSVLLDAEQSLVQPAIDFIAMGLSIDCNRERPVVYNTYQIYLTHSARSLVYNLAVAKKNGFYLGAKLVRGAYLEDERRLTVERGPGFLGRLQWTKLHTDRDYHNAVKVILTAIAAKEKAAVVIATHNLESVLTAGQFMRENRIHADSPNVHFAQLKGTGSYVTSGLCKLGFNANMQLPFAPVKQAVPYLVRQMQETTSAMSSTQVERRLLWAELWRRRFGFGS